MNPALRKLKNESLVEALKSLKTREDSVLVEILDHIYEFDRRKLYLTLGHPNLYHYLTKEMGYSEGEAYRRIESSRFLSLNPELKPMVSDGRLTMTSISEVRTAVRAHERTSKIPLDSRSQVELAMSVASTTRKEAQQILAQKLPDYQPVEYERKQELVDGGIQITMRLSQPQRVKSDQARDILARSGPIANTAGVFEKLCDFFLRKKDLTVPTQRFYPGIETPHQEKRAKRPHIPMSLRRAVFRRDMGRCQFQAPDRKLCATTYDIAIDHIIPVSAGGKNEIENLRCLCRAHNQWKGDRMI